MLLSEQVKPEMIQSMIEVGTGICKDIKEARTDITNFRSILSTLVRKKGLEIVAAGTHPFSHWQDQKIFENARYELIVEENRSEEHTSELQSHSFISYAVFCLKKQI